MFMKRELSDEFPASYVSDVRRVIRELQAAGGSIRIIRVPAADLAPVFDKVCATMPMPFRPVLCGYPVEFADPAEFGGAEELQIIAVRDDETVTQTDQTGKDEGVVWLAS